MRITRIICLGACLLGIFGTALGNSLTLTNILHGIEGPVVQNVIEHLQIEERVKPGTLTVAEILRFHQEGPGVIKKALQPFGYFKPRITSRLTHENGDWQAIYRIRRGPALRVTRLDLQITGEGAGDKKFQRLIKHFPVKQGKVLHTEKYEKAKQALFELASNRGYFAAVMLKSTVRINLKHYTSTVIIHFATGPRYSFGQTIFSKTPLSTRFLRRYLTYAPGEKYSNTKLQRLQQDLGNSNYFQRVMVTPNIKATKNLRVPITADLVPRKAKQYIFGAGYGTDTGPRGLLGIDIRHLGSSGQYFKGKVKASGIRDNLEASYIIPGPNPATDEFNISAAVEREHQALSRSRTEKFGIGYTTLFKGWQQITALSLQNSRFRLEDEPKRRSTMLIPSGNWTRVKSNDPIRPTRGYRINILLQGAAKSVVSNVDFFQATISAKMLKQLTRYQILVLRAVLGTTLVNDLRKLPTPLVYFTGGAKSVRGYRYNRIGPGRELAIASIELRQKIVKHWYIAGFFDAGDASNRAFRHPNKSVGGGLVWLSPIGAIELSAARALDEPDRPWRIQFSMGTEL